MSLVASVASASSDSTTPIADEATDLLTQNADGISDSTVLTPSMTSVWPAFVRPGISPPRARGQPAGPRLFPCLHRPLSADDDDELSHDAYSVDEEQQQYSDEHAAQSGDAHFAITERENPGQGALGAPGRKKRKYTFQHNSSASAAPRSERMRVTVSAPVTGPDS